MFLKVTFVFNTFLNLNFENIDEDNRKLQVIHTFNSLILICCSGSNAPSSYFSIECGGSSTGLASIRSLVIDLNAEELS